MKRSWNTLHVVLGALLLITSLCSVQTLSAEVFKPLSVYLTWQRDPSTTMTVHWVAPAEKHDSIVHYRELNDSTWHQATGNSRPLPEGHDELRVHTVEITGLSPDAIHVFRPNEDGAEYRFRTLPAKLDGSVRFIVGGDMYHEGPEILQEANCRAASFDPMFVVAGGDIAYAAPRSALLPEDHDRWMEFLVRWSEDMVRSDGCLIPIVPAIGNHEVKGRYKQHTDNAAYFYALFAMPGIEGYNVLDCGDYMSVLLLDTEHTHPIEGDQAQWVMETLRDREHVPHKFAAYHVPAYPSVRSFSGKYNPLVRRHWVPSFEKYGLNIAFEHHEHAYKRSHPIKENWYHPDGVVYMGDGAWGTTPRNPRPPTERWYLANTRAAQHFLVIDVDACGRRVSAVDVKTGEVFDQLNQCVYRCVCR